MTEQQKRHSDMAVAAIGALTKVGKLLPENVQPDDISRAIHDLARERDDDERNFKGELSEHQKTLAERDAMKRGLARISRRLTDIELGEGVVLNLRDIARDVRALLNAAAEGNLASGN